MDFKFNEDQELLLESLDEFLDGCGYDAAYFEKCWNENRVPKEFYKAYLDAGFGLLGIPEAFGGTPCDLVTLVAVAERLAKRGFPSEIIGNALQIDDMLTFGNNEQRKIVFDYMMETGCAAFALGMSEPQAGSDSMALATMAEHKDGKVIINGHKCFITNAMEAPYLLCLAKEAANPKAVSMYFVPMEAEGVTRKPMHKIGCKEQGSMCEIYLENVEVPETALVGKFGRGFLQAMKNFEIERLCLAAMCMGIAECAFEEAATYANQRIQFGQPIGANQMIQEMITYDYTKIINMRNLVYYTASKKDNGESIRTECGLAKLYCAQEGFKVVDDCLQIMGGIGYTEDCRISRLWRDIRMHRIGAGTDQIMVHTAGREILKMYSK